MFVCCRVAETTCISISDFLVKTCSWLCPTDRPSPIYTVFSFILNITIIIIAAVFLAKDSSVTCNQSSCRGYYIAFFPLCIINMVFAVYIYYKFTKNLEKGNRACTTMSKLLLYDLGVYFYLFVNPVFVVTWLAVGNEMCGEELVCENLKNYQVMTVLLGVFFGVGIFMFFLSVAVQCCYEDESVIRERKQQGAGGADHYQQYSDDTDERRNRRTESEFRTGIVGSMFSSSSSSNSRNQNNNRSSNNNNNNRNTNQTLQIAGAVASVAVGVAGKGLSKIGNWMSGENNSNTTNNNNSRNENTNVNNNATSASAQSSTQQSQHQQQSIYDGSPVNVQQQNSYPVAQVVVGSGAPPPQQQMGMSNYYHSGNTINNPEYYQQMNNNSNNDDCGSTTTASSSSTTTGLAPPPPQPQPQQQSGGAATYAQPQW